MSLLRLQVMRDSGKIYYYHGKPTTIEDFNVKPNGEVHISTKINESPQIFIKENEDKVDIFLNCFKEIPIKEDLQDPEDHKAGKNLPATGIKSQGTQLYEESKGRFAELSNMLLEDIRKVRQDPKYVPQAKQVANNVAVLINMTKLQVDFLSKV